MGNDVLLDHGQLSCQATIDQRRSEAIDPGEQPFRETDMVFGAATAQCSNDLPGYGVGAVAVNAQGSVEGDDRLGFSEVLMARGAI